ncbi:MAG: heme-dependent oxidative N-demethylase family protein [Ruegeria sp.]
MKPILQEKLPYDIEPGRKLPGIGPTTLSEWLRQDEAFGAQMQRRKDILTSRRSDVLALDSDAAEAAVELLNLVLALVYPGTVDHVVRMDGVHVEIDRSRPLDTLCQIVQEDFCILQKRGDEHVLTGAILCFPASWRLSEKFMRPLIAIHDPVASYDADIARRVQRLFDGIQAERPLWRFNALWYEDPELYQPRSANAPRQKRDRGTANFLRSERQTLVRLPETQAVVFSIHTYVLPMNRLPEMENPA